LARPHVLIVGAGPTGLTAAIECTRRGLPVRIVDRTGSRTDLSKAVGINLQSLCLLEPSGLSDRLIAAGIRITKANLWFDGERLLTLDLSLIDHRYRFLLALPQSETERILGEALAEQGVAVERGTELTGFENTADGVVARLRGPSGDTEVATPLLLGADGPHSTVRTTLGIDFAGRRYPQDWSLADVTLDWPYGDSDINMFMERSGDLVFTVPIAAGRLRVISQTPRALEMLPRGTSVTQVHWQSAFHVALRQAARYQDGCAYLAGDAAHVHSPAGGRGMNLGMWDACAFAARAEAGTLEGYSAERHPIGRRILAFTDQLFNVAEVKTRAAQVVRNFAMRHIASIPAVQRRIVPNMLGVEPARVQPDVLARRP
jgi:2-polyprenyl-6-methoxyphenol hydroxylase-like FAD-dependent oxidoreductase